MNIAFILGVVSAFILCEKGLFGETKVAFFINIHAIVVVGVGTLTAALFSVPLGKLFHILKGTAKMLLVGKQYSPKYVKKLIESILTVAKASKTDRNVFSSTKTAHPFLDEGLRLIADGMLSESELKEVLTRRQQTYSRRYLEESKILLGLSKFPPAFGLLGAVTGMIGMMGKLNSGPELIGQSMAIALVATFWGILVANLVLLPLSDYYKTLADTDSYIRKIIIDGLVLLKRKEAPPLIEEKMNSYLPPKQRIGQGKA